MHGVENLHLALPIMRAPHGTPTPMRAKEAAFLLAASATSFSNSG